MIDKYDQAIEILVNVDGQQVLNSWTAPHSTPGGCLFMYCRPAGVFEADGVMCGCLTMVRMGGRQAIDCRGVDVPLLTRAIAEDSRLARNQIELSKDWLQVSVEDRRLRLRPFAEWQRAMDATIRVGKPWHPEFAPSRTEIQETAKRDAHEVAVV